MLSSALLRAPFCSEVDHAAIRHDRAVALARSTSRGLQRVGGRPAWDERQCDACGAGLCCDLPAEMAVAA